MYSPCHCLYTCVIMTPLIVLIYNGLIDNESHDLWFSEEYFNQNGFQYLFLNHQALRIYLDRLLPQGEEPSEGKDKAIWNAKRLNLNAIFLCKYSGGSSSWGRNLFK